MSNYALNKFANMNGGDVTALYLKLVQGSPNSLSKAYARMQNMALSKKTISLEFIKARVPMQLVVGLGDLDLVKNMINNGVDVNQHTANLRALHMACYKGDVKMAELLLQNNPNIYPYDHLSQTPIMSFFSGTNSYYRLRSSSIDIADNCYQMTRLLVSHGAKLGRREMRAFIYAVKHANLDTVMLLVNEANGDPKFISSWLGSCLHWAVVNEQPGVLEYVLGVFKRSNMDIDLRNSKGETALMKASHHRVQNHKAIKMLLKSGADFCIKDEKGHTSFDLLMKGKHNPELAWLYFDLGSDRDEAELRRAAKSGSPWLQDIIAEIARKKMTDARIAGKNRTVLKMREKPKSFPRLCKMQLMKTQRAKFYEDVSFWDVLSADKSKLAEYAEDSELVKAFFDAKCDDSFSIYCARIRHRFIEALSRNNLIDLSTAVVCEMIKLPAMMYEVMQHEVMIYMEDDDFLKILACCCSNAYETV